MSACWCRLQQNNYPWITISVTMPFSHCNRKRKRILFMTNFITDIEQKFTTISRAILISHQFKNWWVLGKNIPCWTTSWVDKPTVVCPVLDVFACRCLWGGNTAHPAYQNKSNSNMPRNVTYLAYESWGAMIKTRAKHKQHLCPLSKASNNFGDLHSDH